MTLRRALLLLVVLLLPCASWAKGNDVQQLQKATGLHIADGTRQGRAAIVRFMRRETRLERSRGFTVEGCWKARRYVACVVYERGIPDTEHIVTGNRFGLEYELRAKRTNGHWRVWSPDFVFGGGRP